MALTIICYHLQLRRWITQKLRSKSYCTQVYGKKSKSKRYSESLNLPQTTINLTMKNGTAFKRECKIQKTKAFQALYSWQRDQNWSKNFVLHDGPPYANGKPHVGHFVNKVLKDIINRYMILHKCKVHYVPGWDCHGMPIEIKATLNKEGQFQNLSPLETRAKAKQFAESALEEQKRAFQGWGIMGDWENPYKTLDPLYESKQLEIFQKIFEGGYIYRDYMPVYWSPSSQTALAEAELEYNPSHVSKAVYVKFPLLYLPKQLSDLIKGCSDQVYAIIWTTTPWTLPFNQAICYNPSIRYVLLKDFTNQCYYICEESFSETIQTKLQRSLAITDTFEGSCLEDVEYKNPLSDKTLPFLPGEHVAAGKGTALVHTAPAHGHEDFGVAIKHNLSKKCHIDDTGAYCSGVVDSLLGKKIGVDADKKVLELLEPWILHAEDCTHSYPYDWRTKKPVIIRASMQWFIDTDMLKEKSLECLRDVKVIPQQSEKGMVSQINLRPYWCISRQRTWGVPIPVFYHKESGEPLLTRETVHHLCHLFKVHGSDCWWKLPIEKLLPGSLLKKMGKGETSDYVKGEDILDIWFDSGVSWASVLSEFDGQADVYCEGIDQYKGWFQTSLLTSVALRGRAPFKKIMTHSFATDEEGKKMSKSVGNVVDPKDVIVGGKDKKQSPSHGVDVLRWWVSRWHEDTQIRIGPDILTKHSEEVFKIRKCLRHLVGCIHDFDFDRDQVKYTNLTIVDKYMLHLLSTTMEKIDKAYDSFSMNTAAQIILEFVRSDLSSFYINCTRDRNYCEHKNSESRRSSQTVMYHLTKTLTAAFSPIMPHLAQEFHLQTPGVDENNSDTDSIFKCGFHPMNEEWNNPEILKMMKPVLEMRRNLIDKMEDPVEFDAVIYSSPRLCQLLEEIQPERTSFTSSLCEVLQTSSVTIANESMSPPVTDNVIVVNGPSVLADNTEDQEEISDDVNPEDVISYQILITPASMNICERCRKYTTEKSNAPCSRCLATLAIDWAS